MSDANKTSDPVIMFENVYKRLGDTEILRGLDLEIRRGETFVIIGRSGTGKSVTFKHVVGLMHPDRGRVSINGTDMTGASGKKWARVRESFGYLFQHGALINWMTVGANVALPLEEKTRRKKRDIEKIVREKLRLVEMEYAYDYMPANISGGMKKRAGLARAFVMDPDVILYDEPTSGLDPIMSSSINRLILDLKKKTHVTSVVVTHDMESAYAIADRIAMLYEGKIIQTGTPDEIRNTSNPVVRQFITGNVSGPITDGREGA